MKEYFTNASEELKQKVIEKATDMIEELKRNKAMPRRPIDKEDGTTEWVDGRVQVSDYKIEDNVYGRIVFYGSKDAMQFNLNKDCDLSSVHYNADVFNKGSKWVKVEDATLGKQLAKVYDCFKDRIAVKENVSAKPKKELSNDFKAYLELKKAVKENDAKTEDGKAVYWVSDIEKGVFSINGRADFKAVIDINNKTVDYIRFNGKGNPVDRVPFLQIKDKQLKNYVGYYMDKVDEFEKSSNQFDNDTQGVLQACERDNDTHGVSQTCERDNEIEPELD